MKDDPPPPLPKQWPWLFVKFTWYLRRFTAPAKFHAVRVSKAGQPPVDVSGPLIVVMNHPGFWDLIIIYLLAGVWPTRQFWGPIEAVGLAQHRFLAWLGAFPVETGTRRGALQFLHTARAVLAKPHTQLWVTAQGEFTDPRVRPTRLRSGVGHLAAELNDGVVVPVAVEYPFWDQGLPEALIFFGPPVRVGDHPGLKAREWTALLGHALEDAQDKLAADAMTQDPERFTIFVPGKGGVGGLYDLARRVRAWFGGTRFASEHQVAGRRAN